MKTLLSVTALGVLGLAATNLQRAPEGALDAAMALAVVGVALMFVVPWVARRLAKPDVLSL